MDHGNTVEKELLALERRYWQAIKDKDVEAAMELSDDPCFITGAQGVARLDGKSMAAMLEQAPYTLHRFEIAEDAQVRLISADVAVLAYRLREELTVDGEALLLDAADASTWVRRGAHWRCALHSESLAGDPFGRPAKAEALAVAS
jgi:hypothetical protein